MYNYLKSKQSKYVICEQQNYIIFCNRSKLGSSNSETVPTLRKVKEKKKSHMGERGGKRHTSEGVTNLKLVTYWIKWGHGIVDEVIFFLLWSHCVAKANIAVLLIPTVTSATEDQGGRQSWLKTTTTTTTEYCIIKEIWRKWCSCLW